MKLNKFQKLVEEKKETFAASDPHYSIMLKIGQILVLCSEVCSLLGYELEDAAKDALEDE